jgi:hypothetical protein
MKMQWTIHQIDQQYVNGKLVPTTAHWRCSHTEGEFSGSVYSTASVAGLTDLSLDAVLAHLWSNGVSKDATEAACRQQIADAKVKASIQAIEAMQTADEPDARYVGIEFEGVMCSATKEDQNGLVAVLVAFTLQKAAFSPTEFQFVNGNKLVLTASNILQFTSVWMPFRQSFFKPS